MNFKEWFDSKLIVGEFPILVNKDFVPDYKYVINMSDEFYPLIENSILYSNCKTFWFPMNEKRRDIGLNSIYGAMVVLWQAEKENASVYLHCHSGRNRSQLTKACYHYMRTGEQIQNGNEKWINRLHLASARGYLPPMAEMEEFLRSVGKKVVAGNMKGGNLDECKQVINNF